MLFDLFYQPLVFSSPINALTVFMDTLLAYHPSLSPQVLKPMCLLTQPSDPHLENLAPSCADTIFFSVLGLSSIICGDIIFLFHLF